MYPSNRIIWQPTHLYQPHHGFEILLDRAFVKEMWDTKLTKEQQRRMNDLGEETLRRLGYSQVSPYHFDGTTAFVGQITLDGRRGTWLESEGYFGF